jgi:hypothetical protein
MGVEDTDSTPLLPAVDRATWERDAQTRQSLLNARKEAMLREARQRMISKGE